MSSGNLYRKLSWWGVSKIIDGRKVAEDLKKKLFPLVQSLKKERDITPGLAAIRVGEDPASQLYVQMKGAQAKGLGYHFEEHVFPTWVSSEAVEVKINELNQAP